MQREYQLTRDPIFFFTVASFAVLTTAVPAVLGQPRFLPLAQAVALTVFIAIPLRKSDLRSACWVVFLWLIGSMATLGLLTWFIAGRMELAFENGFLHRAAVSEWYYAESILPASFADQPAARLAEVLGITLGSLLTAGLVGAWFLVKAADLAIFSAVSLLLTFDNPIMLPIALPVWSIVQLIGGGGLVVLLAEPLASGHFRIGLRNLVTGRRRFMLIFGGIYVLGLIMELILPGFWHFSSL